ncbi:hypothetical protein DEJ23_07005 [Curtobacterium sp. MCSS17_008]|nr:hypothetical protein DEJ23_07005 [Curtobacterium sp. MCSS17_008]
MITMSFSHGGSCHGAPQGELRAEFGIRSQVCRRVHTHVHRARREGAPLAEVEDGAFSAFDDH